MQLPGGLWWQGERHRDFTFKAVTGAIELAVAECGAQWGDLPSRVTEVLSVALAHVGGQRPEWALVHDLCVGDRQFLMRRLAILLGMDDLWLTEVCRHCSGRFDVHVKLSELPVKEADQGYPFTWVDTSAGQLQLRVPSGADQQVVVGVTDPVVATRLLTELCVVGGSVKEDGALKQPLADKDLEYIESALENVAPEVVTQSRTICTECGQMLNVFLDPYHCLSLNAESLYVEIHTLATHYHWSESDILALPRARRQRYLALIDRARGKMH